MHTMQVGVREAKAKLSKLLKQVQEGHSVVITDRGKPVGRLVPVDSMSLPIEERLESLVNRGWIELKREGRELPPPLPVPRNLHIQELLQEDRSR